MTKRLLSVLLLALLPGVATAIDYRSVSSATVLYDTPSQRGAKLFVIQRDTPVEIVVNLEGWAKVRDAEGGLAWIERKFLAEKRKVIVRAEHAEVRQRPEDAAPLAFSVEKGVVLNFLENLPGGWVKVQHRDGATGCVRASQIWGG